MFRFSKLLNAMVNPNDLQAQRDADRELQAVKQGEMAGGFTIPPDAVRDLTTASGSGDGAVELTHRPDDFIESLLGDNFTLERARTLTGLNGNVDLPAESNIINAEFVAETGTPTELDPTFRQITLTPKRLSTFVDVSRGLLVQGNPDVEDLVRDLLTRQVSRAIDNSVLYGTGSDQPTGIANLTNRNTDITLTAANSRRGDKIYEAICMAEQNLADNNVDESRIEALLSPYWYYSCRFRSWDQGSSNRNTVNSGQAILPTPDAPLLQQYPQTKRGIAASGNGMFFCDWSHVVVGQWSAGFELQVNPYELDISGLIRISINTLVDIQFEHTKAMQRVLVS